MTNTSTMTESRTDITLLYFVVRSIIIIVVTINNVIDTGQQFTPTVSKWADHATR